MAWIKRYGKRLVCFITAVVCVVCCCLCSVSASGVDIGGETVYNIARLGVYQTDTDTIGNSNGYGMSRSDRTFNLSWFWLLPVGNTGSAQRAITCPQPYMTPYAIKGANTTAINEMRVHFQSVAETVSPVSCITLTHQSLASTFDLSVREPFDTNAQISMMYEFKGNSTVWADYPYEWQPLARITFEPVWAGESQAWLTQEIINKCVYLNERIWQRADTDANLNRFVRVYTFTFMHPYELGLCSYEDGVSLEGFTASYQLTVLKNNGGGEIFTSQLEEGTLYDGNFYATQGFYFDMYEIGSDYDTGYNNGFRDGREVGYEDGYDEGFTEGQKDEYSVYGLINTLFNAPAQFIGTMLNFDVFGINLASFVKVLFTFICVAFVIVVALRFIF